MMLAQETMSGTTAKNRRRYQRVPGNGLKATLENGPRPGDSIVVKDISRGGLALLTDWQPQPGLSLTLTLGACFIPIRCRVVRVAAGAVMLAFGQDPANQYAVDRAIRMAARRLKLSNDRTAAARTEMPAPTMADRD